MSVFKCKMCGGAMEVKQGTTVCTCDYCGTQQTLPKLDDDRRAGMFDRANHFRRNNEFDKASGIFEQILNEDSTDAEAYWSLVLCRYGIEYVEDPATHKRLPTVNRAQYTSIYADEDYKAAIANADTLQKTIYEAEAKAIDEIQKGILAISSKEEPFDVFISFKETGADGKRTRDAVLAHELYNELEKEGYKTFFAPVTLEDKLGTEYEPYIFAALNSAKVMVVLGTKPEHFNAVWVKNEWSRFLALIKGGAKKTLIPAYKDMDPYDLPEEFSNLLAQDMNKLGFMQDLLRGIRKIIDADRGEKTTTIKETVIVNNVSGNVPSGNISPLLKRTFMFLEDGDWKSARDYCERVLDIEPENSKAYLAKLMIDLRIRKQEELKDLTYDFTSNTNYIKVMRYADIALSRKMMGYVTCMNRNIEDNQRKEIYDNALILMSKGSVDSYKEAISEFKKISGWKDTNDQIRKCNVAVAEILDREEEEKRKEEEKRSEEEKTKEKQKKKRNILMVIGALVVVGVIGYTVFFFSARYKVGNTVTMGHYEQDYNTSNGKESIEWIVLFNDGDKALLISKHALDWKQYHESCEDIVWGECTLRTWLNHDFLSRAFSTREQGKIINTDVSSMNSVTGQEENTKDKIFLLSAKEAEQYFTTDEARKCDLPDSVIAQVAETNSNVHLGGKYTIRWWLRSPGNYSGYAGYVHTDGSIVISGREINNNLAIRPAMWIDLRPFL